MVIFHSYVSLPEGRCFIILFVTLRCSQIDSPGSYEFSPLVWPWRSGTATDCQFFETAWTTNFLSPLLGDVWPSLRWFWLVYVWSMELIAVRRISEAIHTIYHPHVRKSNWAKCWKNARMFDAETHPDLVGVLGDSALWVSSPQLQLVFFRPTPLKNDGVKVSWDHDIPNLWKVIFFSVPNHQPDKLGKFSASWNLCDYPQTRGTTGTTNIN